VAAPLHKPCNRDFYPAFRSSGTRPLSAIKWVVLHSTEGGTARGVAAYFEGPFADDDGGSTHLVVDDVICYRCLPNGAVCWGAPGANYNGFHIEQCGFARWSTVIWKSHLNTLKRSAWKTAFHCRLFGIPPVFVKAAGLKAGKAGVTTHVECSKAFGGDHTDPGKGWPRLLFMALVRRYHKRIVNV
jgi:hypothetical protein